MYFQISFVTPKENQKHIVGLVDDCGIDFLENLIKDYNLKKFSIDQYIFNISCPSWNNRRYDIVIKDIELLKKIEKFKFRSLISVTVPEGFLGKYYNIQIEKIYEEKWYFFSCHSGYKIYHMMDDDKLIEDWINDGCPKYWNVDIEKEKLIKKKKYKFIFNNGNDSLSFEGYNLLEALERFLIIKVSTQWDYNISPNYVNVLQNIDRIECEEVKNEN